MKGEEKKAKGRSRRRAARVRICVGFGYKMVLCVEKIRKEAIWGEERAVMRGRIGEKVDITGKERDCGHRIREQGQPKGE